MASLDIQSASARTSRRCKLRNSSFSLLVAVCSAGHPLILSNGCCAGTLCILDTKPRHLDDTGISLLGDLAQFAIREMEPSKAGHRGAER
jgi:hypothetical protein